MLRTNTAPAVIPDRPHRPLVVRCGYDGASRRVTFPSAATCRLESLRNRVEECFSLSASPFSLSYTDDDGEEFFIRSEADLTEAISYFVSGDDDGALSSYSGSGGLTYTFSAQKITIRLDVVVEYDGPSLSDTSSISSFRTGTASVSERDGASRGSWSSSGYAYEESYHTYSSSGVPRTIEEEMDLNLEDEDASHSHQGTLVDPLGVLALDSPSSPESETYSPPPQSQMSGSITPRRRSERMRTASIRSSSRPSSPAPSLPPPLIGPESESAPSLLTHSELGSRWLREQSRLAIRKLGPGPRMGAKSARYDSDEESFGSDDERSGDFALVRDARGRYYYSYQSTETSSLSSRSEADFAETDAHAGPSRRPLSGFSSGSSASTTSPSILGTPLPSEPPFEPVRIAEPTGPPILAPDCSACGIRLDYMRYVCIDCGEGEMWKQDAPGKAAFVPPRVPSESDHSEASSDATEWAAARSNGGADSSGSRTVYDHRVRSGSMSTSASTGSLQALMGSASSPTNATYHYGLGPTPPLSPASLRGELQSLTAYAPPPKPSGYELCVACIEVHGIAHSKAAARAAKNELSAPELRRKRKAGELRHTFREKIWGAEGWVDVEYNEDTECTICRSPLFNNRFKCVSCAKFDLCRSCYQKVDEIHPAHVFMSLPDKPLPQVGSSRSNGLGLEDGSQARIVAPQPLRHPGAFCHNCLSDIVGPRFHCAVCASWDLCIQCEGVVMSGGDGSGHTADHIMMKIPIPLPSSEVEAVSRRARDRWFQQDRTVAAGNENSSERRASSSRSSSPTNDTVYAPTAREARGNSPLPPSQIINVTQRDALDHGTKCSNCAEWIMGRRYQCANCPCDPIGYNLCSICELRSYKIHNPLHFFFKFDRPVHIPLQSQRALLPLLYKNKVGKIPAAQAAAANSTINGGGRDPTDYLKYILHRETLCDVHGDQIRGCWLRCAHCAAGFDICQQAESLANHDPTHVFVVFKARVDMTLFRQLADLAATHSKPLLKQPVYLS